MLRGLATVSTVPKIDGSNRLQATSRDVKRPPLGQSSSSKRVPHKGGSRPQSRYALQDRPDVTKGHERPSQRPYGTVKQVDRLLTEGRLTEAVKMVVDAPVSSVNEVVWTVLVKQALKEEKPKFAWELYNQVCHRTYH